MTATTEIERHLLALCDDIVARAGRAGASGCETYAERVTQTSASVEQNELKGASFAEHEAVGIRVLVGDRTGFAYVNHLGDESLDDAIADALAIARASPGDPANGLVAPLPGRVVRGLWDDGIASLEPADVVDSAVRLLDVARNHDRRVSVDNASFAATTGANALASSAGIRAASSEASATWGLFGMAVDGDEVGSFDHVFDAARTRAAVDLKGASTRYAERVLSLLDARAGKSYRGKVLFSSEAFEEIFLEALFESIDGDTVYKKKSRLKDKLGKTVATKGFTLVDDGTVAGALGSACFDREGLPHRRTVIIGDGSLHTFLYDGKAARRAAQRPTGHAQGSARSMPEIGTTNVMVAAGDASDEELLRELGDGLYVGRFSGNVDSVSGDFSGVAKGSFLVERGKKTTPVKETLIAGNVFVGLEKLVAWGSTLHRNMATQCPHVLVDGIDVTAGSAR
jgi:PmbA protein